MASDFDDELFANLLQQAPPSLPRVEVGSPIDRLEFVDNPEPRCPVVLLLDTSQAMSGQALAELNAGLRTFAEVIKEDRLAALRVELALITFGKEVKAWELGSKLDGLQSEPTERIFVPAHTFTPPTLQAAGTGGVSEAVTLGLQVLQQRQQIYQRNGVDYFKPWMLLLSSGQAQAAGWQQAADMIRAMTIRQQILFYAIGVHGADMQTLARFTDTPLFLQSLAFRDLFRWISASLTAVSTNWDTPTTMTLPTCLQPHSTKGTDVR